MRTCGQSFFGFIGGEQTMRIGKSFLAAAIVFSLPALATAQDPSKPPDDTQKPPAAVGEAAAGKPTRGFVSALGHNLVDDVKHIPRRNSVYWLAGGAAAALAVHPLDKKINARLVGHSNPFIAGRAIGQVPAVLGAAATAYVIGCAKGMPRVEHLGMDEIEATLLAEGIVEGAKQIGRRDRPLTVGGARQPGFSFPSGHATTTFAAATVLQQH